MRDVAGAALPVAIALLLATAVARGVLWTGFGDEQSRRNARRWLEPLAVACVFVAAVDVAAVLAAGDATIASFVLPVAVGAVAVLLGVVEEQERAAPAPPEAAMEPAPPPEPYVAPARLWSRAD